MAADILFTISFTDEKVGLNRLNISDALMNTVNEKAILRMVTRL